MNSLSNHSNKTSIRLKLPKGTPVADIHKMTAVFDQAVEAGFSPEETADIFKSVTSLAEAKELLAQKIQTRNYAGPEFTREIATKPQSLNADTRTVRAVIATETPVERWFGQETLLCGKENVDLSRLVGGPLLDSHNRSGIGAVVGRVDDVRFEGRELVATMTFSGSAEGLAAMEKVSEGMIRNVSIGYRIIEAEETRGDDSSVNVTAKRWMPHEVSLVSVPADPNTRIRSQENQTPAPATISSLAKREMADLRRSAESQGLSTTQIEDAFEGAESVDDARTRMFETLAANHRSTSSTPNRGQLNRAANTERQLVDAIAFEFGASKIANDNPFAGNRMQGVMRSFLETNGVATRNMSQSDVVDATFSHRSLWAGTASRSMHATSDFPSLLIQGANRVLIEKYVAELSPLKNFGIKKNQPDYRRTTLVRPGEMARLERLVEGSEIKFGTLQVDDEGAFQIEEFGKAIAISRKALINDDLGVFADALSDFGQSASTLEGDLFYEKLSANSFMGQNYRNNTTLFHADNGNLAETPSLLSVASLSEARKTMRLQKNVNGVGRAGVSPSVILVGPSLETAAEQLVASINAGQVSDVNPFANKLRVEVESRYEGFGWWVFADPKTRPAFVYGYLDGAEGPQIETREGWTTRGMEIRCTLDFGCGAYDHRAIYFNEGVDPNT